MKIVVMIKSVGISHTLFCSDPHKGEARREMQVRKICYVTQEAMI